MHCFLESKRITKGPKKEVSNAKDKITQFIGHLDCLPLLNNNKQITNIIMPFKFRSGLTDPFFSPTKVSNC